MRIIKVERQLCVCCMEEHEVKTVRMPEETVFKNIPVKYEAEYEYCDIADEFYVTEKQLQENDIRLKDSYKKIMVY